MGEVVYLKYLRFTMVDGIDTINSVLGYTSPTILESSGIITVTTSAQFSVKVFVLPNNLNAKWEYISTSIIKIYPPSNYGTMVVEIWER